MKDIYLDHAATTPLIPEVVDAVNNCMVRDYGNPSSLHRLGIAAEKRIKEARGQLSTLVNVSAEEIFFTSGGTEANNLSIFGCAYDRIREGKHLITTVIEHPSVLSAFQYLETQGFEVTYLPVSRQGEISLAQLMEALRADTTLISLMHVNNEIGSIQPLEKAGALLRGRQNRPVLHVDAIQSLGKLPLRPREWGVDLMTFSGHKIHGLKGCGALYKRKGLRLQPLFRGGEQEGGMRSGTENITGIVAMGRAAEWIRGALNRDSQYLYEMKQLLLDELGRKLPQAVVNGPLPTEGAPHIINIAFPGLRGEVLLHTLEDQGIFVSTGSACSSRRRKRSHVLTAIGMDAGKAEGSIRISLSYTTTQEEIKAFIEALTACVDQLARYTRR